MKLFFYNIVPIFFIIAAIILLILKLEYASWCIFGAIILSGHPDNKIKKSE